MKDGKSVIIVGVGGQGTLLASRLLGNVMLSQGYDVKMSEVHGMSQRGGSVVTYVRYGETVYSPVIQDGEADVILAFEQLEAARYLSCLKRGGILLLNTQQIDPMPVVIGAAKYPQGLVQAMQEKGARLLALDALKLAKEAGSAKAVNVVLMGVLSALLQFPEQAWQQALEQCVPPKFLELNKRAFALGRSAQQSH